MKWILSLFIIISIFSSSLLFAEKKVKKTIPETKIIEDPYNNKFKITDTELFFKNYISMQKPTPRGEFETKEEYAKRIIINFDTNQIIYLKVEHNYQYKYDIDNQLFLIYCGEIPTYRDLWHYASKNNYPITIKKDFTKEKEYEATNAYGRTVTVSVISINDFVLLFKNINEFSREYLNKQAGTLKIECTKAPVDAKRLKDETEMIIAVKVHNCPETELEVYSETKATFEEPKEIHPYVYNICTDLQKIILWDKTKKEILTEKDIKAN